MPANAELNLVLDGIIVVLVFVLLYLIYKKVLAPDFEAAEPRVVDESSALQLLDERERLQTQLAELKQKLRTREIDKIVYAHTAEATKAQLAHVQARLRAMQLL